MNKKYINVEQLKQSAILSFNNGILILDCGKNSRDQRNLIYSVDPEGWIILVGKTSYINSLSSKVLKSFFIELCNRDFRSYSQNEQLKMVKFELTLRGF